jgi:DNA end-binding protein Ku
LHAGRAGDLSRTTRRRRCETDRFEQYEYALKELLKKKPFGQKIEAPRDREPSKVVNLMDALRRSVETERAGGEQRKPAARDALAGRPAQRQKRQA